MFQRHVDASTLHKMAQSLIFEEFLKSYVKSVHPYVIACHCTLSYTLVTLPSPPLPSPPLPNRTEIEHFRSQCATVLEEYGREFGMKKNEPALLVCRRGWGTGLSVRWATPIPSPFFAGRSD